MLKGPFIYLAWILVIVLAVVLRTNHTNERPMHADEATGARILAKQLEGAAYTFNPKHFHGPMLTQLTLPIARMRGEQTWSQLSAQTLRSSTLIAGILLIFTPLLWIRLIGKWGAWGAAALFATSPILVYYSGMYIHESWLVLFSMLACASIYHVALAPTSLRAVAAGLSIGLMFATKETFAISIISWVPAVAVILILQKYRLEPDKRLPHFSKYLYAAAIIFVVSISCAGLFYSNFLRNPSQFLDAFRTFFEYETTIGHEKGFGYYFELLFWPKQTAGLWWTEGFVALLALAYVISSIKNKQSLDLSLFLAVSALMHVLIYSAIAYKTPWLMLVPWAHVCLLAGFAFQTIIEQTKLPRLALLALFTFGLVYQTSQSLWANGRLANSTHNPYAYVPTSADCQRLASWLEQLNSMHPLGSIAIVGNEYWPLPWYLRHLATRIGYWKIPNTEMQQLSVVLAMPAQQSAVQQLLSSTHIELPRALRSNVPVILYLRNDIWQAWQRNAPE